MPLPAKETHSQRLHVSKRLQGKRMFTQRRRSIHRELGHWKRLGAKKRNRRFLIELLEDRRLLSANELEALKSPQFEQPSGVSFHTIGVDRKDSAFSSIQTHGPEGEFPGGPGGGGNMPSGPKPEISVLNAIGSEVPDDLGSDSFGTLLAGGTATRLFKVVNNGDADLSIDETSLSLPPHFFIVQSFGDTSLQAFGGYTTFEIGFSASSVGSYGGTLSFENTDTDESPYDFMLSAQVSALNSNSPTTSGLPYVSRPEDSGDVHYLLDNYFEDADTPHGDYLTYEITGNSNAALVGPAIVSGSTLNLSFTENMAGISVVTVRATDTAGQFVEALMTISVGSVNDPPVVENAPGDIQVRPGTVHSVLDLQDVFFDPDPQNPGDGVFVSIEHIDSYSLFNSITLGGNRYLTLYYKDDISGAANITIRGTDAEGAFSLATFKVSADQSGVLSVPTIVVDTADDSVNPLDSYTSLREAIAEAGENPGFDIIGFHPAIANRTLALNHASPLVITSDLKILGLNEGAKIEIRREAQSPEGRIFEVRPNVHFDLSDVNVSGGQRLAGAGGAILNEGHTLLHRVEILGSRAEKGGAVATLSGSSLFLQESTVAGNAASTDGGAIFIDVGAVTYIDSSTISGNTASNHGAAIDNLGILEISSTTIVYNTSAAVSSSIHNEGQASLANTVVASEAGHADVIGGVISLGGNLVGIGNGSVGWSPAQDLVGDVNTPISANFGPLRNNGGRTRTHFPLPGSMAVDLGIHVASLSVDQRGAPRSLDGLDHGSALDSNSAPDAGAVESGAYFVNSGDDLTDATPLGDGKISSSANGEAETLTLRAGIQELNALADLATPLGGMFEGVLIVEPGINPLLTLTGTNEDFSAVGDLDIKGNLKIIGNGLASTVIDGEYRDPLTSAMSDATAIGAEDPQAELSHLSEAYGGDYLGDRIFHVHEFGRLFLKDLTVAGGFQSETSAFGSGLGGGVLVDRGHLHLQSAAIGHSFAENMGGGVYVNQGSFIADAAVIAKNTAAKGAGLANISGESEFTNESVIGRNRGTEQGGGLFVDEGIVTVLGTSRISQNYISSAGGRGAGAFVSQGELLINSGSVVRWNGASHIGAVGAGIYNANGHVGLVQTQLFGNSAGNAYGGAIFNLSTVDIRDSEIFENVANQGGAAVYSAENASTSIKSSSIFANNSDSSHAFAFGGALISDDATLIIEASAIYENSGALWGGAVFSHGADANVSVTGSHFYRNQAVYHGGAIYNQFGTLSINDSTLEGSGRGMGASSTVHSINDNMFLTHTASEPVTLAAAINPWQEVLYFVDVEPLTRLPRPLDIQVGEERMRVLEIDEVYDAVKVQRSSRLSHSVTSKVTNVLTAIQTQISVADGSVFDGASLPMDIVIGDEVLTVHHVSDNVLTVLRGQAGTAPGEHLEPRKVWARSGALTVRNSTFTDNTGVNYGTALHTQVDAFVAPSVIEGSTFYANHDRLPDYPTLEDVSPVITVGHLGNIESWQLFDSRSNPRYQPPHSSGTGVWASMYSPAPEPSWFDENSIEKHPSLFIQNSVIADPITASAFQFNGPLVSHINPKSDSALYRSGTPGFVVSGGGNVIGVDRVGEARLYSEIKSSDDFILVTDSTDVFSRIADSMHDANVLMWISHTFDMGMESYDGLVHDDDLYVREDILVSRIEKVLQHEGAAPVYKLYVVRGLNGTKAVRHPEGSRLAVSATGFHAPSDLVGSALSATARALTHIAEDGGIGADEARIAVANISQLPPTPFAAQLHDPAGYDSTKEDIWVAAIEGSTLIVQRGVNGTTKSPFPTGALLTFNRSVDDRVDATLGGLRTNGTTASHRPTISRSSSQSRQGIARGVTGDTTLVATALPSTLETSTRVYFAVSESPDTRSVMYPLDPTSTTLKFDRVADLPAVPYLVKLSDEILRVTSAPNEDGWVTIERAVGSHEAMDHQGELIAVIGDELGSESEHWLVEDASVFAVLPMVMRVHDELVTVLARDLSTNRITVARSQFDTTPFPADVDVQIEDSYGVETRILFSIGEGATDPSIATLEEHLTRDETVVSVSDASLFVGHTLLRVGQETMGIKTVDTATNTIIVRRGNFAIRFPSQGVAEERSDLLVESQPVEHVPNPAYIHRRPDSWRFTEQSLVRR
jgi:hypothetical protein